jgi:hypothetical protein
MYDLFRFILLRPPDPGALARSIQLEGNNDFVKSLRLARQDSSGAVRSAAGAYLQSDDAASSLANLSLGNALQSFAQGVAANPNITQAKAESLIGQRFSGSSQSVAAGAGFQEDKRRLQNTLIALKLAAPSPAQIVQFDFVPGLIRAANLIERLAVNDPSLSHSGAVAALLQVPIVLPAGLALGDAPSADGPPAPPPGPPAPENNPATEYQSLLEAYDGLTSLQPRDFKPTTQDPVQPVETPPPATVTNETLLTEITGLRTLVARQSDVLNQNIQNAVAPSTFLAEVRLAPTAASVAAFSAPAQAALTSLKVDLATTPVGTALDRVTRRLARLAPAALSAAVEPVSNVKLVGSQAYLQHLVPTTQPATALAAAKSPPLPVTHGSVRPAGIGDLLVVRQQLTGYARGEVAHIENILRGETHEHTVKRAETTEQTTTTEQETTQEEERDLQSTERFEMQRESDSVASMDGKLRGDSFYSPSYGGVLEFQNDNQSGVTGSMQVAQKTASTYSQDVTSRATSRITERTRTQTISRVVRSFRDITRHSFDNKGGADNVVGVYQWVEKLYQAQVYNYGRRLFYDLVVPEPASFVLEALSRQRIEGFDLVKPQPFTLGPMDITEYNYSYYAALYGVSGIETPPPAMQIVSKGWPEQTQGGSTVIATVKDLPLPKGYQASYVSRYYYTIHYYPSPVLDFIVGATHLLKGQDLNGETDSIPVTIKTTNVTNVTLTAEISCERTAAWYQQWQSRAHAAILQGYQSRQSAYEERLANAQAAVRVGLQGLSSDAAQKLMRMELKKFSLALFTGQEFDAFNAIQLVSETDPDSGQTVPYPQPDLAAAGPRGSYVRFFEQALEWEQMLFVFYPYFWGRKQYWLDKVLLEDRDPQFTDFLTAGAARVLIPARPGFEAALAHFMETGEIWNGGDLPEVGDPLYVPLLKEIKAAAQNGDAQPYGDPWTVRLPTSLVLLRPDSTLPEWKQGAGGEWVEASPV